MELGQWLQTSAYDWQQELLRVYHERQLLEQRWKSEERSAQRRTEVALDHLKHDSMILMSLLRTERDLAR